MKLTIADEEDYTPRQDSACFTCKHYERFLESEGWEYPSYWTAQCGLGLKFQENDMYPLNVYVCSKKEKRDVK